VATRSPSYAKYPVSASVLVLLHLLSCYVSCSSELKGVSLDVLTRVVELMTLFNSRTVQLILGAGAMHFNPELKSITSKQLALTSQALSFLCSQLPSLQRALSASFPAKFHLPLARDLGRVGKDLHDHVQELMGKMEHMATEVCEQSCKGSVAWIKREEEIAQAQAGKQAAGASGAPAAAAPALSNNLPSLFKQSSRLLTQTEALYQVVHELVQPSQRQALIGSIARAYVRLFLAHFNSASSGGIVASQLSAPLLRGKIAKRMEATLEKFATWITPEEHANMKRDLGVLMRPATQPSPPAAAAAATTAASTPRAVTPALAPASVLDNQSSAQAADSVASSVASSVTSSVAPPNAVSAPSAASSADASATVAPSVGTAAVDDASSAAASSAAEPSPAADPKPAGTATEPTSTASVVVASEPAVAGPATSDAPSASAATAAEASVAAQAGIDSAAGAGSNEAAGSSADDNALP